MPRAVKSIRHKAAPRVLHHARELRDARRLQTEQDARGLEQRSLPARIRPHDEIRPRCKLRLKLLEAAKVAEGEATEHDPFHCTNVAAQWRGIFPSVAGAFQTRQLFAGGIPGLARPGYRRRSA